MNNFSIVDLYSIILDYNKLFFDEVSFQDKPEQEKSAILLMGLFNYIMEYNDSDLRMDEPSEVVKLDRSYNRYYKVVDDTEIVKLIADYVAVYLSQLEEDLKEYHVTKMDGIKVYTKYLNTLADMYKIKERYSEETLDNIAQELKGLHHDEDMLERSYYH